MRSASILVALSLVVIGTACMLPAVHAQAQTQATATSAPAVAPATEAENRGLDYLVSTQTKDGSWVPMFGPGVTALTLRVMLQGGLGMDHPAVKKGLDYLESKRQPDGGYYDPEAGRASYNSSLVLSTLAIIPGKEYQERITKLQNFLKATQAGSDTFTKDEKGEVINKEHPWYGGFGYSGAKAQRPDLSNTHFVIEALHNSGIKADDPVMQRSIIFVTRCQANSETNTLPWAKGQDNGGFIYNTRYNERIKTFGESLAGVTKDREGNEILVTYGSMTYAGLKSFLYAGLTKDDPRVKAAVRWIAGNYTLETNPGMPPDRAQDGLYYYYNTFARGLAAYGEDTLVDVKGIKHDWRKDVLERMKTAQRPDGSWINLPMGDGKMSRFGESEASYTTAVAVLCLQAARGF